MVKLSIIIPSYNHERFLFDRLESIFNQTYKNWEAIIIDDGSTDNSVEIINQYLRCNPDFKVKNFIVNEFNSGSGYKSWKKGIELAASEYIWIAETDDYSEPNFLEESIGALENYRNVPLVFCSSNYVDENNCFLYDSGNRTLPLGISEGLGGTVKNEVILKGFPFNSFITNGSSVVFRKPAIVMPDELFQNLQMSDLFLWTWLIQKQNVIFLNKKHNNFRRHKDSTTTKIWLYQRGMLYKEYVNYLNFFPDKLKVDLLFEKFINNYWIGQVKKGRFEINLLRDLEDYNFFTLRIKLAMYLLKYMKSKVQNFFK